MIYREKLHGGSDQNWALSICDAKIWSISGIDRTVQASHKAGKIAATHPAMKDEEPEEEEEEEEVEGLT